MKRCQIHQMHYEYKQSPIIKGNRCIQCFTSLIKNSSAVPYEVFKAKQAEKRLSKKKAA